MRYKKSKEVKILERACACFESDRSTPKQRAAALVELTAAAKVIASRPPLVLKWK